MVWKAPQITWQTGMPGLGEFARRSPWGSGTSHVPAPALHARHSSGTAGADTVLEQQLSSSDSSQMSELSRHPGAAAALALLALLALEGTR